MIFETKMWKYCIFVVKMFKYGIFVVKICKNALNDTFQWYPVVIDSSKCFAALILWHSVTFSYIHSVTFVTIFTKPCHKPLLYACAELCIFCAIFLDAILDRAMCLWFYYFETNIFGTNVFGTSILLILGEVFWDKYFVDLMGSFWGQIFCWSLCKYLWTIILLI